MCLKARRKISSFVGRVNNEKRTKTIKDTGKAIICGSITFQGAPRRASQLNKNLHNPIALDSYSWKKSIHKSEIKKPHRMLAFAPAFVPPLQYNAKRYEGMNVAPHRPKKKAVAMATMPSGSKRLIIRVVKMLKTMPILVITVVSTTDLPLSSACSKISLLKDAPRA